MTIILLLSNHSGCIQMSMEPSANSSITTVFPSRKTVSVPSSPLFLLFRNQEFNSYSSRFPGYPKEDIYKIMYNSFQNDKELQRKYKHLYELEVSQENQSVQLGVRSHLSTAKLPSENSGDVSMNRGKLSFTSPSFTPVTPKPLSYQMRVHLLETILSQIQASKNYRINWTDVCNHMASEYHATITTEEAKSTWDSIAYGLNDEGSGKSYKRDSEMDLGDSDDEFLFHTEGKPFRLEQYFQEHSHRGCSSPAHGLLSVDYPDVITSECDLISIQKLCPLSIMPLRDYTYDYTNREVIPDVAASKLDVVLRMISNIFSITEADLRTIWGNDRIKELETVLKDIDLCSAEAQQILLQKIQ